MEKLVKGSFNFEQRNVKSSARRRSKTSRTSKAKKRKTADDAETKEFPNYYESLLEMLSAVENGDSNKHANRATSFPAISSFSTQKDESACVTAAAVAEKSMVEVLNEIVTKEQGSSIETESGIVTGALTMKNPVSNHAGEDKSHSVEEVDGQHNREISKATGHLGNTTPQNIALKGKGKIDGLEEPSHLNATDGLIHDTTDFFHTFDYLISNSDARKLKSRLRLVMKRSKDSNGDEADGSVPTVEDLYLKRSVYFSTALEQHNSLEEVRDVVEPQNLVSAASNEILDYEEGKDVIEPVGFAQYSYTLGKIPQFMQTLLESAESLALRSNSVNFPFDTTSAVLPEAPPVYRLDPKATGRFRNSNPVLLQNHKTRDVMSVYTADKFDLTLRGRLNAFFFYLNAYLDVLYTEQNHWNSKYTRYLCALHVVNHIYKCRRNLMKHNALLKSQLERKWNSEGNKMVYLLKDGEASSQLGQDLLDSDSNDPLRDQGFTRPRVLILSPLCCTAKEIVDAILDAASDNTRTVMNRKRFEAEFGLSPAEKIEMQSSFEKQKKPIDYTELFLGNNNDRYLLGIRLANKGIILYSPFYKSDIIVASPLGLRLVIGAEGGGDFDFLSSLEIVIVDRLDVISMQNWQFLKDVWKVLNLIPQKFRDFDIRRIRHWNIDGNAACYRQTVLLSNGNDPRFNALHNQTANFRGSIKLWNASDNQIPRSIAALGVQQLFQKVPCNHFSGTTDAMLSFFKETALPKFIGSLSKTIVIVPSYLEYVRLWKILKEHGYNFKVCHEYSSNKTLSRSRQAFYNGDCSYLITTSRFLFFRRYVLRGAVHAVFCGPPTYTPLYKEILDNLVSGTNRISMCYYTAFHADHLEKLMGPSRAKALIDAAAFRITAFQ